MDVGILGGYVILGTICEKHFRNNNRFRVSQVHFYFYQVLRLLTILNIQVGFQVGYNVAFETPEL